MGGLGRDMGDLDMMGKQIDHVKGFLGRLLRNQAGNTLAIVAAAIIPLAGLIGGGVDMSRGYMARARLQQACDAAALAGRRAMTTSAMTDANKAEAKKFFDFNFPQGTFGTATFTPVIQSKPGETTTVQVSATTTIPTTIMRIFGYQNMDLAVTCDSRFDIGNTDVMLVLDTTGSMDSAISDGKGGSTTRIAALQQAVRDFYDTLGAGNNSTGRIRYGFVPYASNVNVGYLLPSTALVGGQTGDTWTYNSRIGNYYWENTSNATTCYKQNGLSTCYTTAALADAASGGTTLSGTNCSNWQNASTSNSGSAPSTTTSIAYSYAAWNGSTSTTPSGNTARKCSRKEVTTTKTYNTSTTPAAGRTRYGNWSYTNVALDTTQFITGNSIQNPAYEWGTNTTWGGCIEEASTDNTITATSSTGSVPTTAYDLQIDLIPDTNAKRWKPYWPDASWYRSSTPATSTPWATWSAANDDYGVCAAKARRLATYASRTSNPAVDYGTADTTQSTFNDYVAALSPGGFTNHTTGIMWGARLLSPDGIFSADNVTAPNGFSTSRNIVFMTDGAMMVPNNNYDAWGINALNGRIAATSKTSDELKAIQERRFQIACEAAKRKGITIWIIVFASASNTALDSCATSSNHISVSTDASSLSDDFKDIAKNIGGLRLSQ